MNKVTTALPIALALLIAIAIPAGAQQTIGGHDETSENLGVLWVPGVPNPGLGGAGGGANHLLLSEVVVTPTTGEYVEICNPTGVPVDLSRYHLSDDWFTGVAPPSGYHRLPEAGYVIGITFDFTARFPAGAVIPPGGVYTIAADGAGFLATYGVAPDFELNPTSAAKDMVIVSGNTPLSLALFTNTSEMVMLFFWDGASDNVCDVDYVQWGALASGNGVDKTGAAVDGPDADAIASAYLADTSPAAQTFVVAPGAGASIQRQSCQESPEAVPGNGCVPGGPTPAEQPTWGRIKVMYR
jgi:hypothetical protein